MNCHGCTRTALIVYRVVPYQAATIFDSTPRDVASCAEHAQAARRIGTVLSATTLGTAVVTRVVKD